MFDLTAFMMSVLPMPGIVFRVTTGAVGTLYSRHEDGRPVDADAVVGLTRLDRELVVGALDQAVVDEVLELEADGYRPAAQEPVAMDLEAHKRYQLGLAVDCACGSAAGWPCVTARGRTTGLHLTRRQHAARVWGRDHRGQVAA